MTKITIKQIEQVIDIWEDITDIEQHRDCTTTKELNKYYKQIVEEINNGS